jgi:hypothetical protein
MREDAVNVLARVLPLAAALGRTVRTLALVGLAAAAAIVLVILLHWKPNAGEEWAGLVVLSIFLAVPPAVLLSFAFVLAEVVALPESCKESSSREAAGTTIRQRQSHV